MQNKFRKICHGIVHWKWFELSIDILILINCIFSIGITKSRKSQRNVFVSGYLFTVIFVLEFVMK